MSVKTPLLCLSAPGHLRSCSFRLKHLESSPCGHFLQIQSCEARCIAPPAEAFVSSSASWRPTGAAQSQPCTCHRAPGSCLGTWQDPELHIRQLCCGYADSPGGRSPKSRCARCWRPSLEAAHAVSQIELTGATLSVSLLGTCAMLVGLYW